MHTLLDTARTERIGNSESLIAPSSGIELEAIIALRPCRISSSHSSAPRDFVLQSAKLLPHEAPLKVLRKSREPPQRTGGETHMLVVVIVTVRIVRLAERHAVADHVPGGLRLIEFGTVQMIAVEEQNVARIEIHVDGSMQFGARHYVAVAKGKLGPVVLREDGESTWPKSATRKGCTKRRVAASSRTSRASIRPTSHRKHPRFASTRPGLTRKEPQTGYSKTFGRAVSPKR